jgi:hypothetical protein
VSAAGAALAHAGCARAGSQAEQRARGKACWAEQRLATARVGEKRRGPSWAAGLATAEASAGLAQELGQKKGGGWSEKRKPFQFLKPTQTNEFKQKFEFKHSKQCTSMYATGNSYISLIN